METKIQGLPFGEMTWKNFERLCLRLVEAEADVEHCQFYGVQGQDQGGIDIYARRKLDGGYTVYQCKAVAAIDSAQIRQAVKTFVEGSWAEKADTFVLCTQGSLDRTELANALEKQSTALRKVGVRLESWDSGKLSLKLKDLPKVVYDFFGKAWVEAFCGPEQARQMGNRLTAEEVARLRSRLANLYGLVFDEQDPSLPAAAQSEIPSPPLEDRYVIPDVYEDRIIEYAGTEVSQDERTPEEPVGPTFNSAAFERTSRRARSYRPPTSSRQRRAVEDWLASGPRSIVLGGPGSGKSSLLRFVASDLLKETPTLAFLAEKWGQLLPIWVPFGFWTKAISDQPVPRHSLGDVIRRWIEHWTEEQLWPLVEKALDDDRLLLLVDGLDEYTDEHAATVALHQLQVFVRQRDVPAVVTSRPHGFERLEMQTAGWQLADLAELAPAQQDRLVGIWFLHRAASRKSGSDDAGEAKEATNSQAARFLAELRDSEDIRELAGVPLLLNLLIYLRFVDARLPQNRFKAYDSIVDHLVAKHPRRRRAAALLTDESSGLPDDEAKDGVAWLAYRVQERFGEGLIGRGDAAAAFEEYLQDKELGLGYDRREARSVCRDLLEVGEDTVGLLVKKSRNELGFFHRAFQEFLAAWHLSRVPLEEQLALVGERCADPRWREVLLALFHLTRRTADMRSFVERMRSEELGLAERASVELLLCEAAVGDFHCPVDVAKDVVRETIERVEIGWWMPQRERLLKVMLEGLRSPKVRDIVRGKIEEWFPGRVRYRRNLFAAMAAWPPDSEAMGLLWRGLHDEDAGNQRAAAEALAKLAVGAPEIGDRVAALAFEAVDPKTRAAAIEALMGGWPEHEGIGRVLAEARHSLSPELRLVAISGKVRRKEHGEEDKAELIRLGSRTTNMDLYWDDEVAPALVEGWPREPEVKEICLEVLRQEPWDRRGLDGTVALRVLLEGYPQDEDVAEYCANEIRTDEHPFILLRRYAWQMLARNFEDHPKIVAATDEWLTREKSGLWDDVAAAALVGRTPTAKTKLLSSLEGNRFDHWYARALLEGWGMEDQEVSEKLIRIAFGPAEAASAIGHLLPQIIDDESRCRDRLLALLEDPECRLPNTVMKGLEILGVLQSSPEIVDIALNTVSQHVDTEDLPYRDAIALLTRWHGSDPRVRELAEKELLRRDDRYVDLRHVVAEAYGDDETMRNKIARISSPLPTLLRELIATRLETGHGNDDFILSMLDVYDQETDGEVKTRASIAYYQRLKALGRDTEKEIGRLSDSIVAYGLDHDERRQAAFCGLVTLGRLDVMLAAKERISEDERCAIPVVTGLGPNVPLLKHILRNWDRIKAALGEEFWPRLSKRAHGDLHNLWDAFCSFADEYPSPRDEALEFLEAREKRTTSPNLLRFLGRTRPSSNLLLEYCLGTLGEVGVGGAGYARDSSVVSAELLGSHFGGDSGVLERLVGPDGDKLGRGGVIIALCEGWPDSEELQRVFEDVRRRRPQMFYPVLLQLASRKASDEKLLEVLTEALATFHSGDYRPVDAQGMTHPVIRRIRTDDAFYALLEELLHNNPTASEKATVPRLLGSARGAPPQLRAWCTEAVDRQLGPSKAPQIGFDLSFGSLRPVVHSLMEVLDARPTGP